jgi:hypothetical protein
LTQRIEDVALDEIGLCSDAVEIPLCRGWDVIRPGSLGDGVEQIGRLPQHSTDLRFAADHRHFTFLSSAKPRGLLVLATPKGREGSSVVIAF